MLVHVAKYELHLLLVAVQKVSWYNCGTDPADIVASSESTWLS
jgi:hypothetical protein